VESQNHYYGHSGAFARYLGLRRPRHVRGLVQHGWTAASPVSTHFRDFPSIGAPDGRRDRHLFVWSHGSRAWSPARETRATVAVGAPWLYLQATSAAAAGPGPRRGTVIMPVHGIPTQRLTGDHRATARDWADAEGPSTVCLYHVEAEDPTIVAAYREAGHRCVTLGARTDGAFLGRLHRLLSSADRVVSNRLSTPLVYAASLGVDVAVTGDPMRLEGETLGGATDLRAVWPEFYESGATLDERRAVADAELGAAHLRAPDELRALLGWDASVRPGPWADHWVLAPASRALTNARRRAGGTPPSAAAEASPGLSPVAWLRGAVSYLPHPLHPVEDTSQWEPRVVS